MIRHVVVFSWTDEATPEQRQTVLFSATMPAQIRRISKKYLTDPVEITVKNKTTTSANTTQRYLICSYPQKVDALTRILEVENFEAMIVFVRTKQATEEVAEKLRARGFSAAAINGDRLYLPGADGVVRALDVSTGAAIWTHDVTSGAVYQIDGTTFATIGKDGSIELGEPETLHTDDHASFQTAWEDVRERRGGTENVPYIAAFGKACELAKQNLARDSARLAELRVGAGRARSARESRCWPRRSGTSAAAPGLCRHAEQPMRSLAQPPFSRPCSSLRL